MGQEFRLQGVGYSHIHITTVITPQAGANKDQQLTLRQHKSIEYGNGAKTVAIEGPQMGPIQLAPGGAEPNWKLETARREWQQILDFFGSGYLVIPFDMTNTYQLPGDQAFTDFADGCLIEEDANKSAKGDATMVSLGGKCQVVWPSGFHPFDPNIPRRT